LPCGLAIALWLSGPISLLWTGFTVYKVAGWKYLIHYGLLIANIVVALNNFTQPIKTNFGKCGPLKSALPLPSSFSRNNFDKIYIKKY
jgi:hypothetical protein